MSQNKMIEKLIEEMKQKARDIEKIYFTLQTLREYGEDITLPDLNNLINSGGKDSGSSVGIRSDEFYGMTNNEAAEKYLRKIGHAMPLDDIFVALQEGGIKFTGNGKIVLNNQLTRATRKFAKIHTGTTLNFGLLDFYPDRAKKKVKLQSENGLTEEIESDENNGIDDIKEKAE
ncbi:MAG: hypothetical protein HY807_04745 [Nitrospirae bacterium]|nr:hypothetical protein [Nitrospirota bacterium]